MDLCNELREKTAKTITEIAEQFGISRQTMYESMNGNGSRRVRIAIATTLEKSPLELFEYDNEHKRLLDVHEYNKAVGK